MTWIVDASEGSVGGGLWSWIATPLLSEGSPSWHQWNRTWRSAATYPSRAQAIEAGRWCTSRLSEPVREREGGEGLAGGEILQATVDAYTLDQIDGESAVVTSALLVADHGSRWAGRAVYGRDYLLSLIACGLESGLIQLNDLPCGVFRQAA